MSPSFRQVCATSAPPASSSALSGPRPFRVSVSVVWNPQNVGIIQQDFLKLLRAGKERIQKSRGN